jgi:hypothetical protein
MAPDRLVLDPDDGARIGSRSPRSGAKSQAVLQWVPKGLRIAARRRIKNKPRKIRSWRSHGNSERRALIP